MTNIDVVLAITQRFEQAKLVQASDSRKDLDRAMSIYLEVADLLPRVKLSAGLKVGFYFEIIGYLTKWDSKNEARKRITQLALTTALQFKLEYEARTLRGLLRFCD